MLRRSTASATVRARADDDYVADLRGDVALHPRRDRAAPGRRDATPSPLVAERAGAPPGIERHHEQPPVVVAIDTDQQSDQRERHGALISTTWDGSAHRSARLQGPWHPRGVKAEELLEPRPHDWSIDEREYARQEVRRGRRHAYDDLDPACTALIVVDMVPFFADTGPYFRGIVSNINALAGALRDADGTVAWVLPEVSAPSDWAAGFFGDAVATMFAASGGVGPLQARLWHELDARAAMSGPRSQRPVLSFRGGPPSAQAWLIGMWTLS